MIRRWIIRGLALMLLALCVMAWVGSYWRWAEWVDSDGHYLKALHLGVGTAYILGGKEEDFPKEWVWRVWPIRQDDRSDTNRLVHLTRYHFIGFAWDGDFDMGRIDHIWFAAIPLYFPTLLSALLLVLVWRKTRAKPIGRAFPVEPAKTGGTQA